MTVRKLVSCCLPAVLSFTVLLAGCGGGSSGSGTGGGGTTPPPSTANEWTWMSGSDTVPAGGIPAGVYGTLGTASATNVPGGRSASVSWTDGSGNLWLFGGVGDDSTVDPTDPGNAYGGLNDLWEFSPTTKEWTWVSGSNTINANGIYGTEGIAATGNVPGSRYYAASWIDGSGNLWLFGGAGHDSVGTNGLLNDLWQFNPTTKEWTWVSGSSVMRLNPPGDAGEPGVYGTQGVPAANNVPGGRYGGTVSWIDSTGNLWLFGGTGFDSTGAYGELNDLWEFNPTAKTWTWVSGSSTANAVGVYGNMGVAAASDVPGARSGAVGWIDSSGSLWLFGGAGPNATILNDLWEFDPATKEWTWVSGSSTANATGVYGTQGTPATGNMPGARYSAVSWIDGSGNFWLFGGNANGGYSYLNDLWEFSPTSKEWTWMSGSSTANAAGVYGTLGVPSSNVPGARSTSVSWIDGSGNLWLFGGGNSSTQGTVDFNDLWRYQP
ncbi:MAG: kelch repeat-containing protein [Terracidiphilus sp.]